MQITQGKGRFYVGTLHDGQLSVTPIDSLASANSEPAKPGFRSWDILRIR